MIQQLLEKLPTMELSSNSLELKNLQEVIQLFPKPRQQAQL
jgi:hypothetical protein